MFNDISCGSKKTMNKNAWRMPNSFLWMQKDLEKGQWSFIGPGSEKNWYCISEDSPQGVWDNMAERMFLDFAESGLSNFPRYEPIVQRSTQKQRTWENCPYTMQPILETIETIFRIICLCKPAQSLRSNRGDMWRVWNPSRKNGETRYDGAIKFLTRGKCDQDRITFGLWWPGQPRSSIVAIWRTNWKAVTTRQIDKILYGCRIFWMLLKLDNTSWRKTLQNFHNFMQWPVVNTLFQEKKKKQHNPKRTDPRETQRLVPYQKLQPVTCMVSVELKSEFGLWTETILTPGSEFCDEFEQQWDRHSRSSARRNMR